VTTVTNDSRPVPSVVIYLCFVVGANIRRSMKGKIFDMDEVVVEEDEILDEDESDMDEDENDIGWIDVEE